MPEPNNTANKIQEEIEYSWLIKPCEIYKAEYNDCTSIRARFHQYFIFGETIDCKQWKIDYNNCDLWERKKDKKAYIELIESEKKRRFQRLQAHYSNDIWQKRDKPPENWNAPLPKWLDEKSQNSYLKIVSNREKNKKSEENIKSFCTIM
ncbi:UPF0545 protein C22orf39 homolog [Apis dorsata]|uniref:UPF0545 protein C22orf39 homolog n=1 Tax=Apis dorsata TaxID=7462 RepID=UPI0003DF656D|nr:UPF0545 protein C22orf39 homolog [Apis dorsata]